MLKSIFIKNFQNHKSLKIRFDQYVTAITGRNDVGKSSIIRALRWCLTNRPVGRQFIRHGARETSVRIRLDESVLQRTIKGTSSYYRLNNKRYRALRGNVPAAIRNMANVGSINFGAQHEPTFWFDLSPGRVARELNQLVDLEAIDRVQTIVAKRLRDSKAELGVCQKRKQVAEDGRTRLAPVKRLSTRLSGLEKAYGGLATRAARMARLSDLIAGCSEAADTQRTASALASVAHTANLKASAIQTRQSRIDRLAAVLSGIRAAERDSVALVPDPKRLEPLIERRRRMDGLSALVFKIKQATDVAEHAASRLQTAEAELEKELGGRCPYCFGILTKGIPL